MSLQDQSQKKVPVAEGMPSDRQKQEDGGISTIKRKERRGSWSVMKEQEQSSQSAN